MVYLQQGPGGKNRYCDLRLDGAAIRSVYGRLPRDPASEATRTASFKDEPSAARAYAQRIRSLTHRGYALGHHDEALFEAIRHAPEELEPRLRYAEWLEEVSDPRAELIRVQVALEEDPKNSELRRKEQELLRDPNHWFVRRMWQGRFKWRAGFIDEAVFYYSMSPHAAAAAVRNPSFAAVRTVKLASWPGATHEFRRHLGAAVPERVVRVKANWGPTRHESAGRVIDLFKPLDTDPPRRPAPARPPLSEPYPATPDPDDAPTSWYDGLVRWIWGGSRSRDSNDS